MNNMIKAECYRVRHTSSLVMLLICSLVVAVLPIIDATGYYDSFWDVSGTGYLGLFVSGGVGMASILLPFLMIFLIGYHEDKWYVSCFDKYMDIYFIKKPQILISRVLAVGVPFTSYVILLIGCFMGFFTIKNGFTDVIVGNIFQGNVLLRLMILWVTNVHISAVEICIAYLFRSAKKSTVFTSVFFFLRWIFHLLMDTPRTKLDMLRQRFDPISLQKIAFEGGDNTQLLLWITASVICFVVDVAILCVVYYLIERLKYEKNL